MLVRRPNLPKLPEIDWEYVMNLTTDGLYSLIVTLAVLTMFTILLAMGKLMADSPLISNGFVLITTFWFSGAAHRWASAVQQSQKPLSDAQLAQIEQVVSAGLAKQNTTPPVTSQ